MIESAPILAPKKVKVLSRPSYVVSALILAPKKAKMWAKFLCSM